MNGDSGTLPKRVLSRRPEARGFRIEQLLLDASDGRLRVPQFQRPLRWRSKQIIEYFDSIRRGFPVGDLLLSRDHAPQETLHFGPYTVDAIELQDALWVIDGQQRITALIACLLRKDTVPKNDIWAIWYDLEREEFRRLSRSVAPPGWIPMNALCDSVDLLKWIRAWAYGDSNPDLVDRALELGKAIREYEVPAYIVSGAEESLVRLIFTRVNTAGVGMRESEVFEARYGKEGDKPIRTAVARISDMAFGEIDADLFLRCLRVTNRISANLSLGSPEILENNAIARTEKAVRRAVQAIQAAGIAHWKLLPYRLPLIFLTAFFDRFIDEDSRVDRLVAKWIWRGALSGDHEEVTDAYINRLLKHTELFDKADEALASLLKSNPVDPAKQLANNPESEFDKLVSMNRACSKIFILGLLAAGPRATESKDQSVFDFDEINLDEVEPAGKIPSELGLKKLIVSIAGGKKLGSNVIVRVPDLKLEQLLGLEADEAVLQSHLLDNQATELLRQKKLVRFNNTARKS